MRRVAQQFRNVLPSQPIHISLVAILAWVLVGGILVFALLLPATWAAHHSWPDPVLRLHSLLHLGIAAILGAALTRASEGKRSGYRRSCILLLGATLLPILWAELRLGLSPDLTITRFLASIGLLGIIYLMSALSLTLLVPLRSLPRYPLLRLALNTILLMSSTDVALQLLLPRVVSQWVWTPGVIANEMRLITTIGLMYWYVNLYRWASGFSRRPVILWAFGLVCLLVADSTLLVVVHRDRLGGNTYMMTAAIPWWLLQQLLWALGLYWSGGTTPTWQHTVELHPGIGSRLSWLPAARQGLVVVTLAAIMVLGPVLSYVRWSFVVILGCHVALRTYEFVTANQRLRLYATQAEELATSNERNRMAREIHDGLGHYFTSINAQLAAAQVLLDVNRPRALTALETAQRLTDEGLADVRRSVTTLREATNRPLPEALESLVRNACAAGVVTRLQVDGTPRELPQQAREALFRVAQEGLNNVRKHAQASCTDVLLAYQAPKRVCLVIQDDGTGTYDTRGGHGMAIMQERVQAVGGTLRTCSAPGQGFRIEVEVSG